MIQYGRHNVSYSLASPPGSSMYHFATGILEMTIEGSGGFSSSHLIGVKEECALDKGLYNEFRILRDTINYGLPGLA